MHERAEGRDHLGGDQRDRRAPRHPDNVAAAGAWDHLVCVSSSARLEAIDAAARAALEPLGLVRLDAGTWLDDHGWWVVVADFETVGARGTRLVLYADFLWHVRDRPERSVAARVRERGRLLDQDGRELACAAQLDEAELVDAAARLAERAATEVRSWREAFPTMRSWSAYLDGSAEDGGLWREYDAAVAAGLAGEGDRARRWFDRVFDHPVRPEMYPDPDADHVVQAQRVAAALTARLAEPAAFRSAVAQQVDATRERLHLAPLAAG
jgi:hypothetical protein